MSVKQGLSKTYKPIAEKDRVHTRYIEILDVIKKAPPSKAKSLPESEFLDGLRDYAEFTEVKVDQGQQVKRNKPKRGGKKIISKPVINVQENKKLEREVLERDFYLKNYNVDQVILKPKANKEFKIPGRLRKRIQKEIKLGKAPEQPVSEDHLSVNEKLNKKAKEEMEKMGDKEKERYEKGVKKELLQARKNKKAELLTQLYTKFGEQGRLAYGRLDLLFRNRRNDPTQFKKEKIVAGGEKIFIDDPIPRIEADINDILAEMEDIKRIQALEKENRPKKTKKKGIKDLIRGKPKPEKKITVAELKKILKDAGIKGYSTWKKDRLLKEVENLKENKGNISESSPKRTRSKSKTSKSSRSSSSKRTRSKSKNSKSSKSSKTSRSSSKTSRSSSSKSDSKKTKALAKKIVEKFKKKYFTKDEIKEEYLKKAKAKKQSKEVFLMNKLEKMSSDKDALVLAKESIEKLL